MNLLLDTHTLLWWLDDNATLSEGARVAIAEEYRLGGTCVIRGCVPKKLLVYGSKYAHEFEDSAAYGWSLGEATHSWATTTAKQLEFPPRRNPVTPV